MIDRKALLDDLKQQVKAVEADLAKQVKVVSEGAKLRAEYDRARTLGRTAATWNSWLDERITQVAVAWVLGTVFVRFCEDNQLIPEPYLTAPEADRRDLALARYEAYVETDDDPTFRGWLERAFAELGAGQAGRLLFDRKHNPLFQIPLSHDGARELVAFWRERDEAGALVHDFTDQLNEDGTEGWDTRFLGDLYQDLSEAAQKTYALLQTPEFVEEFILDRTMNPAVREFGYEGLKMIDPTCGSGHFVLGTFRRLIRLWGEGQPGKDLHERVRAALDSVHGVDLNPFAVAVARFRLLVAAMAASGVETVAEAANHEWPIHLAVGDSLIKHRYRQGNLFEDTEAEAVDEVAEFKYETEDVQEHRDILLQGRYHVVVGNPPYITVKDKNLNELYRGLYDACAGTYALSVPFAQRFFELARKGEPESGRGYGMVGQITANSFMKREFGARLIEKYFGHEVELTEVIDSSGAYIPGHGTPTVILVGRQRGGNHRSETIRTVRSIQGEPVAPENGEDGLVWGAIVDQIDKPGSTSKWVSVDDLERGRYFGSQPWILAAGGREMVEQLDQASVQPMKRAIEPPIGRAIRAGADEAYVRPLRSTYKATANHKGLRPLVNGEIVRDWGAESEEAIWFPYAEELHPDGLNAELWPLRRTLQARRTFQGDMADAGLEWWDYMQYTSSAYQTPLSITFAEVATHNHFAMDRGGRVFKQTSPVIKLNKEASEKEYLGLLGLLNSSTACFWLKMACQDKPSNGVGRGLESEKWTVRYQFNGTNVERLPLPSAYPTILATALDALTQKLTAVTPSSLAAQTTPTATSLREACVTWHATRARMIALQEELDWHVYSLYALHSEDLRVPDAPDDLTIPQIALGERAFEIALARQVAHEGVESDWFRRHGSRAITEIPENWPTPYREIVKRRIDAIKSSRAIGMIENPEFKRRWLSETWDELQEKALRSWLLGRVSKVDLELWMITVHGSGRSHG